MRERIIGLLGQNGIDCAGCLPLSSCHIGRPYLLERAGISHGSVILFAIPYYTHECDGKRNISAYATGRDYHLFFSGLSEKLLAVLRTEYPDNRFAAFADHSPIDERNAAARAGLGILGQNRLLITKKYSSYVFLGEIITDANLKPTGDGRIRYCENCGLCQSVCPRRRGDCVDCLSAITQKKGKLSESEEDILCRHGLAWGCDLCQEVCPHTVSAKAAGTLYTGIPYFEEAPLLTLTAADIGNMSEDDFKTRAYAWRGKETILRNLNILEKAGTESKKNDKKTTEGKT